MISAAAVDIRSGGTVFGRCDMRTEARHAVRMLMVVRVMNMAACSARIDMAEVSIMAA